MSLGFHIGISCSSSWIKVVRAFHRSAVETSYATQVAPVPAGCIHERSGSIEDSRALEGLLDGLSLMRPRVLELCNISLALPRSSSFTKSFLVVGRSKPLSFQEFENAYAHELPAHSRLLCVDLYQRIDPSGSGVRVMLVAVRRDLLDGYVRLFGAGRRNLIRITTDEVARFNVALQGEPAILNEDVLLVWLGKDCAEISLWESGMLVAGDSIGRRSGAPTAGFVHDRVGRNVGRDDPSDLVGMVVSKIQTLLLTRQRERRPIHRVIMCGPRKRDTFVAQCMEVAVSHSVQVAPLRVPHSVVVPDPARSSSESDGVDSGFFDEAVGAVLPDLMHRNVVRDIVREEPTPRVPRYRGRV